jgi:hypothetical protein
MTRRVLLLCCVVVAAACSEEPRVPAPPPAEAPSTSQTSSQALPADPSSEVDVRTAQAEDAAGAQDAVAVIDAYYAAINGRDYDHAYRYWSGEGSASGQSLEQFTKGFTGTAAVEIRTGPPGRVDPAAGSRYVEIPIEITATTTAGETQRFRGHYVLRRSVVDGATAEQRQWRIASAKISRAQPPSS